MKGKREEAAFVRPPRVLASHQHRPLVVAAGTTVAEITGSDRLGTLAVDARSRGP
jgi:hypothetical protein